MATSWISIDLTKSAERTNEDVETLGGPDFTSSAEAICRYPFTPEFQNATDYLKGELEAAGFDAREDPVGNLVGRNRPKGEAAFALGSHHDSNRNGGKFDGTLGVVAALEVCRLNQELGLDLPLQLISFIEEEASGFGQGVLGSRIMVGDVSEEDLREKLRATDDGRSFWEHAEAAGHDPANWRDCSQALEGLTGWIELHIEQGLVLQEGNMHVGIVNAIVGVNWVDLVFHGRADHAGGTAMQNRADAGLVAAETVVELERIVNEQTVATVGTAGVGEFMPGLYNVIPGEARLGLDIRSVDAAIYDDVIAQIGTFATGARSRTRGDGRRFDQPAHDGDGPRRERRRRARCGGEGQRSRVHAHALRRRARHPDHCAARSERDGLRSLQGRDQPLARRGCRHRRRGRCRRGDAERDRPLQRPLRRAMIEIDGRQILTTLPEKVDPAHSAVVVIDMQKDFTAAGCFWDNLGQLDLGAIEGVATRLRAFLDSARECHIPVIHVMANYDPQFMNDPMHERLHRHGIGRYCQSGHRGHRVPRRARAEGGRAPSSSSTASTRCMTPSST